VLAAAALLGAGGLSAILAGPGGGPWLPLHLALAGAAGTAIASVLPFFTTALAQVAPARPAMRIGSIAMIGGGSVLAAIGMSGSAPIVAATGGTAYLAGLLVLALSAFLPLRAALGSRRRLVLLAYGAALAQVGVGVALATAMLAGWAPVSAGWMMLKPAHAWLNVFGFVVLAIGASLVHLAPTVAGARIRRRGSATVAIGALLAGAPLIALGYVVGSDLVARGGAILELAGAGALFLHGAGVQGDRGQWTSDPGWHRFAQLSLLIAPAWLLVAVGIGAGRIVWLGATPAAWSIGLLAIPLVVGGISQVLAGAWTHLVPAIGPGDQSAHAIARRWLGRLATTRLLAWNLGTALATIGVLSDATAVTASGALLVGGALASSLGLLGLAATLSLRRAPVAVA
jgi:nitrite reductase (NO-forming)